MKTALKILEILFSSEREMDAEDWLNKEENKGKSISEMYEAVFPDLLTLYETLQKKEKIKGELINYFAKLSKPLNNINKSTNKNEA